jgi:putative nucleotidyltransferase with HDIG domain
MLTPRAESDGARPRRARDPRGGPGARARRDSIIRPRPRARRLHQILLSLAFALAGTPILMASGWVVEAVEFRTAEEAPVSVRVPLLLGRTADEPERRQGGIVAARGEKVADAAAVDGVRHLQPGGWAWLIYLVALFVVGVIYTEQLRRSRKGRLLRTQVVLLGLQLGLALIADLFLLMTPLAAVALPAALLAIATAVVIDLGAALATALVSALVLGGLTPFDPGVITVVAVQGACAALFLGDRPVKRTGRLTVLAAGAVGGGAAALTYFLIYYLSWNQPPLAELAAPLRSAWLAAGAAGIVAALIAIPCLPLFQQMMGDVTLGTLIELEDLSHPLLKQIAESSPGTWQHSLAMANMAQIAANAIGADGRLIRVGAYYHDLGKSLQPKYFIENLSGGEPSPHDALPPPVSCDAIFAHVTEGVRVARRHGLHERVIDFMHMHHGDGLLEYFWVKCQEQGNPDDMSEDDFRYPGVKPHSPETAILAICDAVEAASRTLRSPDPQAIEALVQRIVYGKLHLGQLDDSGLTVADLRVISNSLMDTIKHAHHGRIEYPWQRRKSDEMAAATAATAPGRPTGRDGVTTPSEAVLTPPADGTEGDSPTQRLLREPRLDSLDAPRPAWRSRGPAARGSGSLETAATEPLPSDSDATWGLTRPPTAAEVARTTAEMMPVQSPTPPPLASEAPRAAAPAPARPRNRSTADGPRGGPTDGLLARPPGGLGEGTGRNDTPVREAPGEGEAELAPPTPSEGDQRS